ncbi:MAG: cadherin repeat domain-containing protein, partial [Opitutales bacterium]|nr:cadherin repeat domain-containing protein [Opitutales bacterium]
WLDASELGYAGETWQDKSLSNNHATRNGSAQGFPTILKNFQNGHSVMHYNGAPMSYHDFEEIGNVRTVFWVVGRSTGSGSLLGDSDSSQFFSGTEQFWFNGMADNKVLSGDTFLRGRKIYGSTTPIPSSLEILSFRSSADLNASRFGRSSNGKAFIGELGELIIFDKALANWEMAQVECYLAQKWSLPIDRSISEFTVNSEGVLRNTIKFNFDDTSSRSLFVRSTNENNQSVINSHVVAITDVTGGTSPSDIDGDGLSNNFEISLGYDPYDPHSKNSAPANLRAFNDLEISESLSVGLVIGKLTADDPDYLAELTYTLTYGDGAGDNSKLSMSENGEIKLLTSLDYEKQTSLSFRAKVVDENNASIEKAFILSVIDVFEDENNNGVEDHLDSDLDGDGIPNESDPDRDGDEVSNIDELLNGSDPDNAKSTNRPPTNLVNNSALSIQENQPKGTIISKIVPQDPDGVQGYSYLLVEGTGGTNNELFEIDLHGNLSTAVFFDYENNASSYSVRIKAEDPYGKSIEKAFSIALTNSDQFSPISIDADLMLWLDASDKSTLDKSNSLGGAGQPKDGESVKFWADKSGFGHHAITSNSGTYSENSLNEYYPSIDTTGDTFVLENSAESFDVWSEMTISMVYQYSTESYWTPGIWKHGNGNGNNIQGGWSFDRMNMNNRSVGLWWAKASMVDGDSASRLMGGDSFGSKQSAKVITIRFDGSSTNLKYFANGRFIKESNETESSFVSNLSDTLKIGNSYKWGEILIFKNALPDTKRELIEGYLAHKWGMDSEMDEGHPFYENPVVSGYESYEANFSNRAPTDIYLELDDQIIEGKPLGSVVNSIGVVDPDISNLFEYSLVAGEGDDQNSFFKLSEDGDLITLKAIDYEQYPELSLRVKVTDDHNNSLSKALTITVVNVVEDADNDGIEDHEDPSIDSDQDGIEDSDDPDIDGDGMTNSQEIANGSDPRDANSINHAPSSIFSAATLSFRENQPAGILVGQLTATDQDEGAIHEFFLINGDGDTDNSLFTLSESGELRTAHTFDYDNNKSIYSIRVQTQDEYFASIENNFTVKLENDVWLSPQHLGDNLMLWLDASDSSNFDKGENLGDLGPPENANGVGFWADKSGKEHNARPRPIYNKPKWKSSGFNQLPGIDFASSMMAIDNSSKSFDAWSELTLFAVLEHDDVNFSPLFGKTNYAGWMSNDKDMSWAVFTHRLDGNYNHWGPTVITNTPANHYGSSPGSKALQVNDGGGPGILMFSYRSGSMIMHINGEQKLNHTGLTGTIQTKPDLDFTISGKHNGGSAHKMRLGELLIFKDVLTAENVKKVEGQLAHKWALTHVLPSTHTYTKSLNLDGSISFVENLPTTTVIVAISDIVSDYNSSLDYSLSE